MRAGSRQMRAWDEGELMERLMERVGVRGIEMSTYKYNMLCMK